MRGNEIQVITTLGARSADELGMILPHEHIFVDLRTWDQPDYAQADPQDVIRLMEPEIERARAEGVTAIVECSTRGVGRRADIDKAVSEATAFPIVIPTGFYRGLFGISCGKATYGGTLIKRIDDSLQD